MNRHAYLIIAHDQPETLADLIQCLNHENHDFYIMIDKKKEVQDFKSIIRQMNISKNIDFVDQVSINWGTDSQVFAELILFQTAFRKNEYYSYYHLLSGVDFPLRKANDIYNFFENSYPKEFVEIDNEGSLAEEEMKRIKFYSAPSLFLNIHLSRRAYSVLTRKIYWPIQSFIKMNRLKETDTIFCKGSNWVSITDNFVRRLMNENIKSQIRKFGKRTFCGDEFLLQTILINSPDLLKNHYNFNGRLIDWERGNPYTFSDEDLDALIKDSKKFIFARKFPGVGSKLRYNLKKWINE